MADDRLAPEGGHRRGHVTSTGDPKPSFQINAIGHLKLPIKGSATPGGLPQNS